MIVDKHLLRSYMKFRGFTIRGLAEKVECSYSTIGHYLTGERKTCDTDRAKRIAKALDMPLEPLFLPEVSRLTQETRRRKSA